MRQSLHLMEPTLQSDERVVAIESKSNSDYKSSEEEDSHASEHLMEANCPMQGNVTKSKNPSI